MDKYLEWIKDLFPDLFALAVDREGSVTSYLANPSEGEVRHWNPSINTCLHLTVEIEFCGCQQRVGYLRFIPIIMPLGFHVPLFSEEEDLGR